MAEVDSEKLLIYLVYGSSHDYRLEARFSILSAIYRSEGLIPRILVITDDDSFLHGLPASAQSVDRHQLEIWSGADKYHHRCKPLALLSVVDQAKKNVFVDTDTVFLKSPSELFDQVEAGRLLVDQIEGEYGKPEDVYKTTCGPLLEKKYGVGSSLKYINSGVIGLCSQDKDVLERAVGVIDELFLMSGKMFHVEQFGLAVAAFSRQMEIKAQNGVVHHYWSRKYVHRAIAKAFLRAHPDPLSDSSKEAFLDLEFRLPRPPAIARLWHKVIAQFVSNQNQLRQFYIELRRAMFPYTGIFREVRGDMAVKAYLNLRERNPLLFNEIMEGGLGAAISPRLFPAGMMEEIAAAVRDSKDLDWGVKRERVESPDSSGD